jgi:hypothetical protein
LQGDKGDQGDAGPQGLPGQSWPESFETIAKNLRGKPYMLSYNGAQITAITYDLGGGESITKTLNYTGDKLTSITLSGDVPAGAATTKTLTYEGDHLTNIRYS